MSLLQFAGRLYSLDTLDARFTTSSKTPPSHIDPVKPSPKESQVADGASAPKWKTPEFLYHGLVFVVLVPWMFFTAYDVSQRIAFIPCFL